MRTKKTNIKSGKVTRTVPFTKVNFLTVDIATREVKEETHIFILDYNKIEAENALRELGLNVAAVTSVETYEKKISISYEKLFTYGEVEE
jgi:hypothetical protein